MNKSLFYTHINEDGYTIFIYVCNKCGDDDNVKHVLKYATDRDLINKDFIKYIYDPSIAQFLFDVDNKFFKYIVNNDDIDLLIEAVNKNY